MGRGQPPAWHTDRAHRRVVPRAPWTALHILIEPEVVPDGHDSVAARRALPEMNSLSKVA